MIISYPVGIAPQPQPTLGGSALRPRPILPIRIYGQGNSALRDGILDTGADDTVFPERIAAFLGIDLTQSPQRTMNLAGRGLLHCRFAPVRLRITDGFSETYEWTAVVAFVPVALHYPLLGFAGFLQFFDAHFKGADREVILTPNRDFPGQGIP